MLRCFSPTPLIRVDFARRLSIQRCVSSVKTRFGCHHFIKGVGAEVGGFILAILYKDAVIRYFDLT